MSCSVSGRLPELRRDLHHDMILIQRREHGGYLPLAEGIVEGVVDQLGRDPEPRGRAAVDHQRGLAALVLLIAVDVDELGQRPQALSDPRCPGVELSDVLRPAACTDTARCWSVRRCGDPGPPAGNVGAPGTLASLPRRRAIT